MAIYQLDLDLLESARDGYKESAKTLSADIETLYGTVTKTSEDIYSGVDADTFRNGLTNYTSSQFAELWEQTEKFAKALTSGLEDGKKCKKLCNDFTLALDGISNGKAWEDMSGMLYCDQDVIMGLQDICRNAMTESNAIRESATAIDNILSGLQMTHINSTYYTNAIRAGCNKVERLYNYSCKLTTYAAAVEDSDSSFQIGVDDFTFMTPAEASLLAENPQTKAVMTIMNKPGSELTAKDREILDKNLRILIQNNEILELETLAEQMGNHPDGIWTAGDIYVAAKIIDYSETKGDTRTATAVYNRMKKVTLIGITSDMYSDSLDSTYTYEVSLDKNIIKRILDELDPVDNGLAYYSLQRRRNYTEEISIIVSGFEAIEPEINFDISFESKDGRLISLFETEGKKMKLSSIDMNEVVGTDGTSNLKRLGFTEPEIQALKSCIYTDEDLTFIGNLSRANMEEDYREVFQNNPNDLSLYAKLGLYNYSLALLDKNLTYDDKMKITGQDFGQLENFINGMLYRKSESSMYDDFETGNQNPFKIDYRSQYLQAMITVGEIQMDCIRFQIESNYEDATYIRDILPVFAENTQMLSLYSTLECRLSEYPGYRIENYIQISGLGLDNNSQKNILGNDMNEVMFSYCEEVMYNDQACGTEKAITTEIEIMKSNGKNIAVDYLTNDFVKKAKEAKYAFPKEFLEKCVTIITTLRPEIAAASECAGLINSGISVIDAYCEAEETGEKIYSMLGGTQISYKPSNDLSFGDSVPVMGGQYDANALLKVTWLKNEGIKSFSDVNQDAMEKVAKLIKEKASEKSLFNKSELQELENLYAQYILIQGKSHEDEFKNSCHAQILNDISPDEVVKVIQHLQSEYMATMQEFDYLNYNIIDNYYMRVDDEK